MNKSPVDTADDLVATIKRSRDLVEVLDDILERTLWHSVPSRPAKSLIEVLQDELETAEREAAALRDRLNGDDVSLPGALPQKSEEKLKA